MKHSKENKSEKGKQYERCVRAFCRSKGFKILHQNLRTPKTEIDCLAWDPRLQQFIVIEVRGRSNLKYPPSKFISPQKLKKLRDFSFFLAWTKKRSVKLYLLEILGPLPKEHLRWGLEFFPELLGLQIKSYAIDG